MLLGVEEAAIWDAGHYAFVNVWRPVCKVVRSAPLGFVRPRTVQPTDWVTLDLIYPDRVGQIMGLVGNPQHEWLYLSGMTSDEVVFFNIRDNRGRTPTEPTVPTRNLSQVNLVFQAKCERIRDK